MLEFIKNEILKLGGDIKDVEKTNSDVDMIIDVLKERIIENTHMYFNTDDIELIKKIKEELKKYYNLLYYYQAKKNGVMKAYLLDQDLRKLPNVYVVEQEPERFELDEGLLNKIDISEGLTIDQALTLLKWTVNNTRDNLNKEEGRGNEVLGDIYGNSSLSGYCGFSQFSSLYPLEQLGLEVTINNVGEVSKCKHAYGTVVIPIKTEDGIIEKRFIIDCTYRQFFTLPFNIISRYFDSNPDVGFFIEQDSEKIAFAKELLKNGFIEASMDNLEKYLKPFFASSLPITATSKIDKEFSKIDILDAIENHQQEFDFTEDEFVDDGLNLSIPITQEKNYNF